MKTLLLINKEGINYYITALNESQRNLIVDSHRNKDFEVANNLLKINWNDIKLIGESNNVNKDLRIGAKISPYIDSFEANCGGERQKHYRDYTKTLKQQKDTAWLVNICVDYRSSWKTIMIKLENPKYCIIWGDNENKEYEYII